MKILKNILIGLGIIFILFILLAVFLSYKSYDFFEENKGFVEEFSYDLAEHWQIEDVHSRVSNEFLQSLDTPNGKEFLKYAKGLGPLIEATDFQMGNYHAGTDGTTGVITFKATYTNAKALVTVIVIKREEQVRIHGFNVSAPDGLSAPVIREREA